MGSVRYKNMSLYLSFPPSKIKNNTSSFYEMRTRSLHAKQIISTIQHQLIWKKTHIVDDKKNNFDEKKKMIGDKD